MTDNEMRIAIAEVCGYQRRVSIDEYDNTVHWCLYDAKGNCIASGLPDYLNDLNAMHEAENYAQRDLMDADQWEAYGRWLEELHPTAIVTINGSVDYYEIACIANATARQRAEAFLRTLGKWATAPGNEVGV